VPGERARARANETPSVRRPSDGRPTAAGRPDGAKSGGVSSRSASPHPPSTPPHVGLVFSHTRDRDDAAYRTARARAPFADALVHDAIMATSSSSAAVRRLIYRCARDARAARTAADARTATATPADGEAYRDVIRRRDGADAT